MCSSDAWAPWWPRWTSSGLQHEMQKSDQKDQKGGFASVRNTLWLQSPGASTGLGFWDLLAHIVEQPVPVPPPGPAVSPQLADFLTQALTKVRGRALNGSLAAVSPSTPWLLTTHPTVSGCSVTKESPHAT